LGYLPRVLFFNAFELGAESANQVISKDEASSSQFALRGESKSNFFLLLGKCSIPFLSGNLYLMVPSFISMMVPTVQRKGLPKIIGHEALHSTSITRKSMGTRLLLTINKNIINLS
jgi:hypothetical protein